MKKERVRSKHGFKGLGTFILGWFVGFICTILILAGIGYWAYTSLSVKKIEKWTKSNITSNKGLEDMTLQDAVAIVQGISKGSSEYTLAKFEEDFGINILGDTIYGINLDILKNAPIKDFKQAINDTINTATFANILSFMEVGEDLGLLNTILDSEITYYINNGKLYTDSGYSTEVDFDYTISSTEVEFANGKHTIKSSGGYTIVTPTLEHVPLKTAMNEIENATKGMKICEILDYHYDPVTKKYYQTYSNGAYSDAVSGVMNAIAGYTIDDLSNQSKIDELKIHEVMGYYYNEADESYYTTSTYDENSKVAGVMNALAGKELGDLSKESTFNNLYIYQVMGYIQVQISSDPVEYKYVDKNGDITGIMATLAGKTVGGLDDDGAFNDILLVDALDYTVDGDIVYESDETTKVTGVVKHLVLMNSTISTIASDVKTLTIDQILDVDPTDTNTSPVIKALCNKNSTIDTLNNDVKTLTLIEILGGNPNNNPIIDALQTSSISTMSDDINNLTLGTALGVDEVDSTGGIKVLYNTKITGLDSAMDDLRVCEAMGYYYDEPNNKYYNKYNGETYSDEVIFTGIMKAIASTKVNELSTTIDTLRAIDVLDVDDTPVLRLFITDYGTASEDRTELTTNYNNTGNGLTIMELPNAVVDRLNSEGTTIGDLIAVGVIKLDEGVEASDYVKNLTISRLIEELSAIM